MVGGYAYGVVDVFVECGLFFLSGVNSLCSYTSGVGDLLVEL